MNPFYLSAMLSLTAAVLSVALQAVVASNLAPTVGALQWLRVHFITIGTVTMFLFGSAPAMLAARSGGRPQSPTMTWTQWGVLNVGYLILLVGMPGRDAWLPSVGAAVVFVAVGLLLVSLLRIAGSSPHGARIALRFYVTAPFFFLVGITMAVGLLLGWPAPGGRLGILEAHVHANVWGFLALTVAGTLLELLPRLVGQPLAHHEWVGRIYWSLLVGCTGLVVGPWANLHAITLAGLAIYVFGTALLVINLAQTASRTQRVLPPAAGHLLLGYIWIVTPVFFAPFIVLAPELVPAARIEAAAVQGLVFGWVLQMAMGGIPSVLQGIVPALSRMDSASDALPSSWLTIVLLNLGVASLWVFHLLPPGSVSTLGIAGGYGLVALGLLVFLGRLWMALPRRFPLAT